MKKIGLTITGLALAGIMTFGVNNTPEFSAFNKGDTPAPQISDLAHGDHGGAPAYDHGRPPAPAYEYVDVYMDHGEHI
ncbi:Phr family secreted Rap phosphatase inhibitor [Bacillus thuringiensis]|uniref:Phr family secreted Rap phosphatase inhibitor n=1 Tax=Bacillus thuringiensis TaxID=1428 RepID=UPI002AB4D0A4|nr:Phr family secreted Rap phosphatase inhibitor [Bacillus thuringiensis]MDY7965715.1 Phr family secreted Rap phosphatase inhibitor [Bacillus thuringiensis]